MHGIARERDSNLFLALVIVLATAVIAGSLNALETGSLSDQPKTVVTLTESLGHCGALSLRADCSHDSRGVRRGGGVFMKAPD